MKPKNMNGDIGEELLAISDAMRRQRDRANMTQAEVASAMHISRCQVANIERTDSAPSCRSLLLFARAVGVKPSKLLEDAGL